jgi:hypothetical protein
MTYELSDEQKQGVLSASDDKQFKYFVDKAADWGEVWALRRGEDLGTIRDPDTGKPSLAVWPHPDFAQDDAVDGWKAHRPEPIAIHRFVELLREHEREGRSVAVMHQPNGDYLEVSAGALADALLDALDAVQ